MMKNAVEKVLEYRALIKVRDSLKELLNYDQPFTIDEDIRARLRRTLNKEFLDDVEKEIEERFAQGKEKGNGETAAV